MAVIADDCIMLNKGFAIYNAVTADLCFGVNNKN